MPCKEFRVGVFFDGTGNSKAEKATYSNVAKLHDLYEVKKEKAFVSEKIYITGLGTAKVGQGSYMQVDNSDGSSDHYGGHSNEGIDALAAGDGGAKRIYDTIDRVAELLDAHPYHRSDDTKFMTRTIDVFGFSRGAAEARDFVNTFIEETINFIESYKDVRFNFIGIFDTVGSFGEAGNAIDMKPRREYADEVGEGDHDWHGGFDDHEGDKRYEPYNFHLSSAQAHTIIHLTARDELRHNFPLFNAQGAAREYACIGVHSDIGGGYAPSDREELLVSMPLRELDKRRTLEQHGWKYDAHRTDRITGIYKKQRVVSNKLQDVTLHMMHQQALLKKVPFKPLSIPIDPALGEYANHALKHPASLHSYAGATAIKETYAHQSATHPLTTTLSYPLRAREDTGELIGSNTVNVRDRRIQRDVYTNQTSRAVSPA